MFSVLLSFFKTRQFSAGDNVNYVPTGGIPLKDGCVVGQDHRGVHVEFQAGGVTTVDARDLCLIS